MHSYLDAKILARNLRSALAERGTDLPHGQCLDLVARQFGLTDWNHLSARIAAAAARAGADEPDLPADWAITRQTDRELYRIGLDPAQPGVLRIASRYGRSEGLVLPPDSHGVVIQSVEALPHLGRRMALSAELATEDADGAAIWMRIDRASGAEPLRFDNLAGRRGSDGPLTGDCGWTARRIVLDVPAQATSLHYGVLLRGHGAALARNLRLEEAAPDWPLTSGGGRLLPGPANLDFARRA